MRSIFSGLRGPVALTLLLGAAQAFCHGASVWAERVDDTVIVEVFYSNAQPAASGTVRVSTSNGSLLVEGKTDETGRFSFSPGTTAALDVHVRLPDGHTATTVLDAAAEPE